MPAQSLPEVEAAVPEMEKICFSFLLSCEYVKEGAMDCLKVEGMPVCLDFPGWTFFGLFGNEFVALTEFWAHRSSVGTRCGPEARA